MRQNKRDAYFWAEKHWHKRRPKTVEKQVERFWNEKDENKRKRIYEYLQLERILANYGKIRF